MVMKDIESSSERESCTDLNDVKVPFLAQKRATFSSSVFNLSSTIVGVGVMSLPAAIKVLGVIPGILLINLGAFLTEASIEFLLRFSKASGSFSYCCLMEDAFGRTGKIFLQLSVVVNNVGTNIIYLIIIDDVLSGSTSNGVHHLGVLEEWYGEQWWTSRTFVLLTLSLFAIIPMIWCKNIDSLRYTSAVAVVLAVMFIGIVVGITSFILANGTINEPAWFPHIDSFSSFSNLFTAVPVLVCAYVCWSRCPPQFV